LQIELADAVAAVRDELLEAVARGADPDLVFKVGPVELEFAVELRAAATARAGFKAWVVSADAEASATRGRTHRVKVTLTPQQPGGDDLLVHGSASRPKGPGDVSERIND